VVTKGMDYKVSNIVYSPILHFLKKKGIDRNILFTEEQYKSIKNPLKNSSWNQFHAILCKLDELVKTEDDLQLISNYSVQAEEFDRLRAIFSGFISVSFLYWCQAKYIGKYLFNNFTYSYERLDSKRILIKITSARELKTDLLFNIYKKVFEYFPSQIGQPNSDVSMVISSQSKVSFIIGLNEQPSFFKKLKLLLRSPLGLKSFVDLMAELQNAKEELEIAKAEVEEQKNDRELLLKVLAHDIATPLTIINNYTKKLVRNSPDDQNIVEYGERILLASEHINLCSQNARKIITKEDNFVAVPVDIQSIIDKAFSNVRRLAKLKQIKLEIKVHNRNIMANLHDVSISVISNFLTNAIKYSSMNSKVYITSSIRMNTACISIQDFGIGMTKDTVNKILNGESHNSKEGTKGEKGIGQGLLIASTIIKKYKGSLEISSSPEGTTVRVYFPLEKTRRLPQESLSR
jgi:signal transduction histidine kinase